MENHTGGERRLNLDQLIGPVSGKALLVHECSQELRVASALVPVVS